MHNVDGGGTGGQRLEVLHRVGQVGQARPGVVIELIQLPFPLAPFGDVDLVTDEMSEPTAGVADS